MQYISKPVGIDLGTTNSAVAVMNATDSEVVIHRDTASKRATTPSCVWKDPKTGEIVVGHKAFGRRGTMPSPVRSIKRWMGPPSRVRLTDEELTPEEISSYILMEMKRQILEDVLKFNTADTQWLVDRAIVTIPAYFDTDQIEATRKAGELAGLELVELLHEPTAAACYHCWQTGRYDGNYMVYDLGGGTFDVSILRSNAGAFQVLGISGNRRLGGDDLDVAIAEELHERLVREGAALDLDLKHNDEDRLIFERLQLLAEGIKKELSTSFEYILRNSSLTDKDGVPLIIDTTFERSDIEKRVRPIIERTIPYCYEALAQAEQAAQITLADIDQVILAGGSTHMPLVREMVRDSFCAMQGGNANERRAKCSEPVYDKVDTLVALGAAIRAAANGGMAVCNAERSVRVSFRGTGTTGARQTHIGGKVKGLNAPLDLTGGRVLLTVAESDFADESDLNDGTFAFKSVPLQPGSENLLTFEVFDGNGQRLATVGRPIAQTKERTKPDGGIISTAVQSKPLLLGVIKDGEDSLFELIPSLKPLPADETFNFDHPGDTKFVVFPLFSQKRKIKEIKVPVDSSLPRGTPVTLKVNVDALGLITVTGKVGDVEFDASVECPPPRQMPGDDEVRKLQLAFQDALQYLPKGKQMVASARYEKAKASFEAAVARNDSEQAIHDFEEMEEVVAGLSKPKGAVQPGKQVFDTLVSECFEINNYAAEQLAESSQPFDKRETAKAIEAQRTQGEKAILDGNQKRYSDAIVMLENIQSHLKGLLHNERQKNDKRTESEKVQSQVQGAGAQAQKVEDLAMAVGNKDLETESKNIRAELQKLAHDAQKDPTTVREKVDRLWARLEQMKNTLMGKKEPDEEGKRVVV